LVAVGANAGITGIQASVTGGGFAIVTALVLYAIVRGKPGNVSRHPIPQGEVRTRLYDLAEDAQVRVKEAYLVPRSRWRLVNVFGAPDRVVHLTSEVVSQLSRREVDALLALELAFLWCRRWLWKPVVLQLAILSVVIGSAALVLFLIPGGADVLFRFWPCFLVPVFFVLPLTSRPLRRFAPELDREAVARTRDAEALITSLAKLAGLRLLPLYDPQWEESRAEQRLHIRLEAIADRAGIPPPRREEILASPGSGQEEYAPLHVEPATAAPPFGTTAAPSSRTN
jgi:Zn-dependent protease with chaperone function